MKRAMFWLLMVGLVMSLPHTAAAKDVYVAANGDDAAPGTQDKPLATIQKALDAMRGAGGGTIWIGPGEYFVEQGVKLDAAHSGTEQQPLIIRGTEPGKARLSGGRPVKDFRPITPAEAKPLISDEAKKHVLVADLKAQGFDPLDKLPVQYHSHGAEEVVFDDRPMQSARWPNEGFAVFTEVIDAGASKPVHWVRREVYRPGSFRFPTDRAKRWNFDRGVWLHGFWCYDWADEAIKAGSFNAETGELRLAAKHGYGVGNPWKADSKRHFCVLHVFEELDQPGEYYLDRENHRLYFWPPADVNKHAVEVTLSTNPLLRADKVSHLVVRDLVIENGRREGVSFRGCSQARIESCVVRNVGQNGIDVSGEHVSVVRCEVTQTGRRGISAHGGDRKTLTPGNCSILASTVHHTGRIDWGGGRGVTLSGCGNRAAHNLVHHTPTGAYLYSGNEHVLEFNEAHHVCEIYSDVGVFYTGRDWASRGNIVRWNYIHDSINNEGHGSVGIYLDDCDSGDTVIGNIVFGAVGRGVLLGGGRDNTLIGNIFIDMPRGIHVDARGPRGITLDQPGSWNLLAKCEAVDYLSPLWKKRYPRLAATMDNDPLLPMGNLMHRNILIGCKKPFALSGDVKPEWLDRKDNLIAEMADYPSLPAAGQGELDLTILPAIWKNVPGFEPIPFEKIGPDGMP